MRDKFKIQFNRMSQSDLNELIARFLKDQQIFFATTSVMLYNKFKEFPDKMTFDANNKVHLSYFRLKFLRSIFFAYRKNIMLKINSGQKYFVITDQFGFIIGFTKKQFEKTINGSQDSSYAPQTLSQQVNELLTQVFGKQYFQIDQKKKIALSIDHGGTKPIECSMGMDISTAVVGVSIFQNINNKPIFLDAIMLTKLCDKQKLENNLINKLKLFKDYFETILKQKNIVITKLFIEQEMKRFGMSTNANTLNKLRKFNGMISGYLMQRLQSLQQVSFINVRSRRKMVLGKRMSKEEAYQLFKQMYKQLNEVEYKQIASRDANMDRSDAFIISAAGIGVKYSKYDSIKRIKKPKKNKSLI